MSTIAHLGESIDAGQASLSGLCGEQSDLGALLGQLDDER
ncbi:hypothetical protein BJ979_002375 [Schumannella luteola]|uniref:Uncharacterized protein n=1 Tax=Schumannella luteola TaxID=472059 RepID=A0A852YPU4_9MICO|nr:hypothetical protein [Schumannella luteola]